MTSAAERRAAQQTAVDALVAEALAAPQLSPKVAAAMGASDRAVAGLADTLSAIDQAERVVINNLRNAETTGFRSVRTLCGEGREVVSRLELNQGPVESTGRPLDVAISGDGFFQIQVFTPDHPKGGTGYTRNGNLFINHDGTLVLGTGAGYKVIPPITVPATATDVTIAQDGTVNVSLAGAVPKRTVGRLGLVRFLNPSSLRHVAGGIYAETDASGQAVEAAPGEGSAGVLLQGYLEGSNVDLNRERLRLRFLQNWRASIYRAIEGDPATAPKRDGSAG